MATNPNDPLVAPTLNPPGNGLANNPAASGTQPVLPAPLPVTPVAPTTSVNGTAGQSTATGYTATPYQVAPAGLVQNRVKDIVAQDSPLLQMARQQATQEQAARGLVNSSLNTQAGENAVIAQSLPIATADAQAINAAMTNTANAKNTASQFGAAAQNTASQTNAQLETAMNQTNANAKNNALSASALAENTRNLAAIDNNNKQALAVLSQQNSQLLQTNANAANMFQETVKNIAAISVNDTLTPAAKNSAIQTQMNLLNEGLKTSGAVGGTVPAEIDQLNLGEFFQTAGGNSAAFTPAQKQAQIANLDSQIQAAQTRLTDVTKNGTGVPVLSGPNASERRVPLWNQAIAEAKQALADLQAQRNLLNAP